MEPTETFDPMATRAARPHRSGPMIWGLIPLAVHTSGRETGGRLFAFEHADMSGGGPPRHVLRPGQTLFAPRGVPHGWAHVGGGPGTLLTIVTPVGRFEDFLLDTTRHLTLPSPAEVAAAFEAADMTLVGPPLTVGD